MTTPRFNLDQFPLWTAVITPFQSNGSVDYESLTTILRQQETAKNAVLLLGSTGEALALNLEERKEVLRFAGEMNLAVPTMVGVGGIDLPEQTAWIEYLNTIEVDAYLVVTPLYAKPGKVGQTLWFQNLLDTATRPCMLYNVPGRTGIDMHVEAIKSLNGHKNFWAIKEASGSVEKFAAYVAAAPDAKVYSGDDGMLPEFAKVGASGLVSVASNAWARATNAYTDLCLAGDYSKVTNWPRWADTLFTASNPIPVKSLMHHQQIISQPNLRLPLTHADLPSLGPLVETDQEITQWLQGLGE